MLRDGCARVYIAGFRFRLHRLSVEGETFKLGHNERSGTNERRATRYRVVVLTPSTTARLRRQEIIDFPEQREYRPVAFESRSRASHPTFQFGFRKPLL